MSYSKPNASPATMSRNRVAAAPQSGICATCLDGCPGPCEVGRSALRGREVLYPQPYSKITAGAEKDYPVDLSHFNIQGTCVGAVGVSADSDRATFPAVDISTTVGAKEKIKMKVPYFTGALGSTDIARIHWEPMAIAAALSGTLVVVGENVCGMDPQAEFKNGRVVRSPEMERRVKTFQRWHNGYGGIIVQYNVEDGRLGVPEYAVEKLGVEIIEPKWGQGAKDIGGEVKLPTLERALQLKSRGYIVLPDPEDPVIQEAFQQGDFKEFERHSRLGMVTEDGFHQEVERLRRIGTKHISLKTGAYRPVDLARAVKYASDAKIDLLTVDGAGGGTGMSPWRMMNEWGIPTVYLESLLYQYLKQLEKKKAYICHGGRPFAGGSHLQSDRPGRPLHQGHLPRPGLHDCGHGRGDHRGNDQERQSSAGNRQIRNGCRAYFHPGLPAQGEIREGFRANPHRGHRDDHLLRPPERRPATAHGRGKEVCSEAHKPG